MSTKKTIDKINEFKDYMREPTVARNRIEQLLDPYSFVEIGAYNTDADVIIGYGTIDNKMVYVYSQNGPVNVSHADKIGSIYSHAIKMGAPVIGIMDSEGLRISDGIDSLEAYGKLFSNQTVASGVVPQISVILGDCLGLSTFIPVLSDFVYITQEKARFFMSSPNTYEGIEGKKTTYEQVGSGKSHGTKSGLVHFSYSNEIQCLEGVRELISFLPSNNASEAPIVQTGDDLNRIDEELDYLIPDDPNEPFDVLKVINSVVDNGHFLEIQKDFSKSLIIGFARFNGVTTGIIANQSLHNKGLLNIEAIQKAVEFVNICDAFNIPLVSFTDVQGYETKLSEEAKGIMRFGAKLIYTFANSTVPKINVILRKGIGNAYLLMNSKHTGTDIVYAWPTAEISVMNREGSVNVMKMTEEEYDEISNPYTIAAKGYLDDIIVPSNTRKRILIALEMLATKEDIIPVRKHSTVDI